MWKSINSSHQRQCRGAITVVDINVNGHFTRNDNQLEVEVVIMETKRKRFLFTCVTPLMAGGTVNKYLGTLADKTSGDKVLSGE